MPDRFFLADLPQSSTAVLRGPEAHHLGQVLRAQPGLEVTLFDGRGGAYRARVARVGKDHVALDVLEPLPFEQAPRRRLVLAVSLPKGDRQRWLVEKATELGVERLIPLVTARGVAQPTDATLERLRRTVIEACKQCGRNRLMQISPPLDVGQLLKTTMDEEIGCGVAAHPGATMTIKSLVERIARLGEHQAAVVAVGPEGGFTAEECAQIQAADWDLVGLGPRILRVETAALAIAACLVLAAEPA